MAKMNGKHTGEGDVLVLYCFDVEAWQDQNRQDWTWTALCGLTDGGDGRHNFAKLEFVEDRGLSGSIKADHQNSC